MPCYGGVSPSSIPCHGLGAGKNDTLSVYRVLLDLVKEEEENKQHKFFTTGGPGWLVILLPLIPLLLLLLLILMALLLLPIIQRLFKEYNSLSLHITNNLLQ